MLPEDLSSAGAVTAARAAFELRMLRVMDRAVGRFVRDVYDAAAAAWDAPTILAAASEPFTLGATLTRWGPVTDALLERLAVAAGAAADSRFLGQVARRLRDSQMPLDVYQATRDTLAGALAAGDRPNRTVLKAKLRRTLIPRGADSQWKTAGKRIARTETTAVFNHVVEQQLILDGVPFKRWVTRHDARVRPTHARADGQTVDVGLPFLVGGWTMMAPGDPTAPHSETAACRCVVAGVRRR